LSITWTQTQTQRLNELDAPQREMARLFEGAESRERAYKRLEKQLVREHRSALNEFRQTGSRPALCKLESTLVDVLIKEGFVQVSTPVIMSKGLLAKMSIGADHPLQSQIFWIDGKKCLRPMLAPHLYYILVDLLRLWERPVRIFEVGPCFRKESKGALHASEFTMLNLVEMGLPVEDRENRIRDLGTLVSKAAGIKDFHFETVHSEVYGNTLDVVAGSDNTEIGSSAMGPHSLDRPWKITDNWVGIGFGLERLLMVAKHTNNLAKVGRSLTYLNGIRLNI